MQPILVDLDGTAGFLYVVRIRGVLCEAAHPDACNLATFEHRVRRADYPNEADLRAAVRNLAMRLIDYLFADCAAWCEARGDVLHVEPLSTQEAIVILLQYLTLAAKHRGEDLTPYLDGSFSLIAEDDGVTKARAKLAANLPPGRTIGAPSASTPVEPQKGAAADAS